MQGEEKLHPDLCTRLQNNIPYTLIFFNQGHAKWLTLVIKEILICIYKAIII